MFVQVIEGKTTDPKALMEHGDRWQQEVRPGYRRSRYQRVVRRVSVQNFTAR